MTSSASRSSERLKDKARKDAEEKEWLETEAESESEGLPIDGSLKFYYRTDKSGAFNVKYKDLRWTADDTTYCSWAIQAFWDASDFYPGQIIKFTHAFAQSNPKAKYDDYLGDYASTISGPVGAKYRYAVVLWPTTTGLFVIPLYTLKGGEHFAVMDENRIEDFVTLTIDSAEDPQYTEWAGHSLIMNYNPNIKGLADCCYADLGMARTIGRKEYLQEDIGSLDGDEYLRLLSLYKIRSNEWMNKAFDQFECGTTFDDSKIVQPGSIHDPRKQYDDLEGWQKIMADKKFKGSFLSQKARDRYIEKQKKQKKPSKDGGPGSGPGSGPGPGPGPGKGSGGGKGWGGGKGSHSGVTKPPPGGGTAKKLLKPKLFLK